MSRVLVANSIASKIATFHEHRDIQATAAHLHACTRVSRAYNPRQHVFKGLELEHLLAEVLDTKG